MPTKKTVTLTAFNKMENRVSNLEVEMTEMRSTLVEVQKSVKEGHATLVAMMEKCLGKRVTEEEERASIITRSTPTKESPEEKIGNSSGSQVDTVTEFRHSAKKVELPPFDGEDPAGWISRAEVYFRVQGTSPEVKVELAQLCMEGHTIHFFNSLVGEDETMTWDSLKEALLERYGGHGDGDVYEQLTELRQTGTVEEYILEFEYLIAQIPKLPEKQFRGYFIHGLKSEIKGKVRSMVALGDVSRLKLLQVARAVEKEVKGYSGSGSHRGLKHGPYRPSQGGKPDWLMIKGREGSSNGGGTRSNFNGPRNDKQTQGDRRRTGPRERGFTHLSYNELMDRKQKGLCFKCGGPFHPMHQCPDKQLRLLVIEDEDEEDGEARVLAVEVEEEEKEEKGEMSVLDLHHIAHENHQTMKFQ
ncbi:retrotransposon gag protein, partial [Trifolium medium]|nr:retrotransposon gag protein [Trifolium medium]